MMFDRVLSALRVFTTRGDGRNSRGLLNSFCILVTTSAAASVFAFFKLGDLPAFKPLLQQDEFKRDAYWDQEAGQAVLREIAQYEMTRLPHRGGWAVEERCRSPIDVLFFVHAYSSKWRRRVVLRDTLVEEAAARHFNWTAVFFVGRRANDPILDAWLNLEADSVGDLVVFPFEDGYRTVTPKFLAGMHWVTDHCPNVPVIVKLDDDVAVHPFKLAWYLQEQFPREPTRLHCGVMDRQPVVRRPQSRFFVRTDEVPMTEYFRYCSGRAVILTFDVMLSLLRAAPKVHPHPTDDAYVTGDVALVQGIGHVDIYPLILSEDDGPVICLFLEKCIFMHWEFSKHGMSVENAQLALDSRFYWGVLLWSEKVLAGETLNLSLRLKSLEYRLAFQETRKALVRRKRATKRKKRISRLRIAHRKSREISYLQHQRK